MSDHITFLLLGLGTGAVYAALALGLVTTYRSSGVINFGTGAVALYSAYTFAYLREGQLFSPIPWDSGRHELRRTPGDPACAHHLDRDRRSVGGSAVRLRLSTVASRLTGGQGRGEHRADVVHPEPARGATGNEPSDHEQRAAVANHHHRCRACLHRPPVVRRGRRRGRRCAGRTHRVHPLRSRHPSGRRVGTRRAGQRPVAGQDRRGELGALVCCCRRRRRAHRADRPAVSSGIHVVRRSCARRCAGRSADASGTSDRGRTGHRNAAVGGGEPSGHGSPFPGSRGRYAHPPGPDSRRPHVSPGRSPPARRRRPTLTRQSTVAAKRPVRRDRRPRSRGRRASCSPVGTGGRR